MESETSSGLLDGFYTRKQLAKELRVTERTIQRYQTLRDGLPSILIGGRTMYRRDDVRAFLARQVKHPNPGRR